MPGPKYTYPLDLDHHLPDPKIPFLSLVTQVTVTDSSELCVNIIVWGSQNVRSLLSVVTLLQPGTIVSCRNLEWRQSGRSPVASLHYTDKSIITTSPKHNELQEKTRLKYFVLIILISQISHVYFEMYRILGFEPSINHIYCGF